MTSCLNLPILAGLATLALAGCSDNPSRKFGATRNGENEVRVTAPPPLSMPPVLTQRAPHPGAGDADSITGYGDTGQAAPVSAGQDALIDAAGPSAPANIRQRVDQDAQIRRQDPGLTDALLFGQPSGSTPIIQSGGKSWMDSIF